VVACRLSTGLVRCVPNGLLAGQLVFVVAGLLACLFAVAPVGIWAPCRFHCPAVFAGQWCGGHLLDTRCVRAAGGRGCHHGRQQL
jgi:hypothetical protein